jgi:hypothetical protein
MIISCERFYAAVGFAKERRKNGELPTQNRRRAHIGRFSEGPEFAFRRNRMVPNGALGDIEVIAGQVTGSGNLFFGIVGRPQGSKSSREDMPPLEMRSRCCTVRAFSECLSSLGSHPPIPGHFHDILVMEMAGS